MPIAHWDRTAGDVDLRAAFLHFTLKLGPEQGRGERGAHDLELGNIDVLSSGLVDVLLNQCAHDGAIRHGPGLIGCLIATALERFPCRKAIDRSPTGEGIDGEVVTR